MLVSMSVLFWKYFTLQAFDTVCLHGTHLF